MRQSANAPDCEQCLDEYRRFLDLNHIHITASSLDFSTCSAVTDGAKRMKMKKLALAASLSALIGVPLTVSADSDYQTTSPAGSATATANLDFEVNIPGFVFFQLGSAATTDTVQFLNVGGATPTAQELPYVNVILRTNAGDVTLASDGTAAPLTGTDGTIIPWNEITADNTINGGTSTITPPTIGGSVNIPAAGGLIDATDVWTFSFNNGATYPAQQYLGSVVFTASVGP
jgi:hypothetical protein